MRPHGPTGWLRQTWIDIGYPTQVATIGLVVAGTVLAEFGLLGDARDWWRDRPFATNVMSGATTGAFGIAIALFLIRALVTYQADSLLRSKMQARVADAVTEFTNSVYFLIAVDEEALQRQIVSAADVSLELQLYISQQKQLTIEAQSNNEDAYRERLLDARAVLETVRLEIQSRLFSDVQGMERAWIVAQDEWESLNRTVKPQAVDAGLPWLRSVTQAKLHAALKLTDSPLVAISEYAGSGLTHYLAYIREVLDDFSEEGVFALVSECAATSSPIQDMKPYIDGKNLMNNEVYRLYEFRDGVNSLLNEIGSGMYVESREDVGKS